MTINIKRWLFRDDGEAVEGAIISAVYASTNATIAATTATDAKGMYAFGLAVATTYDIWEDWYYQRRIASGGIKAQFAELDVRGTLSAANLNSPHDIISAHTYTGGSVLDLIGLSAASTPALITPESNPGAAGKILRTDGSGYLILKRLSLTENLYPGTGTATQATGYFTADATGNILVIGGKAIFVNDSANAKMTTGLTINQGGADDEILSLKSSDVAHGVTGVAETDTYCYLSKAIGASGGMALVGLSNINRGWYASGICATAPDTTKSTAATGALEMRAYLKSGTGTTVVGADGNLLVVSNGGTTRFIFDAEGSAHADVEWTTFQSEDDVGLLEDFETELLRSRKSAALAGIDPGSIPDRKRKLLSQYNLVHWPQDGEMGEFGDDARAMINLTGLAKLKVGAIRQINQKVEAGIGAVESLSARVALLEAKLAALGVK